MQWLILRKLNPTFLRMATSIHLLFSSRNGRLSTGNRFEATVDHLREKEPKYRHQLSFLRHLFYYVHRKHLKRFSKYSLFADVMKNGTYDCVSGTALYALLLEGLNIPYEIWEMDYHAYLTLKVEGKTIVFEATDPVHGFIAQPEQIEEHLNLYKSAARAFKEAHGQKEALIHRAVTLKQLAGLQFYNRAIKALLDQRAEVARQFAQQALTYYPAPRIKRLLEMPSGEIQVQ